jgi:hypothetical protein
VFDQRETDGKSIISIDELNKLAVLELEDSYV